jgi:phospholipid-translocating ATPase
VPNFALLALPLTDLTKKGLPNVLEWTDAQERAFNSLRQYLVNPPILRLPDYKKQFILQTDAASEGIGAILLQEEEGCRYPVAFASRKLLPRECNYATIEKECLAVVWGVQKFQTYLYGSQFILETDHQPLQYLQQNNFQNSRLTRWSLSLQPYRFTLRYIKGCLNVGADFLSRNYAMDP